MTLHSILLTLPIAVASFAASAAERGVYMDPYEFYEAYAEDYGYEHEYDQPYDLPSRYDRDPDWGSAEVDDWAGSNAATTTQAAPEVRCSRHYKGRPHRSAKSPAATAPRC